MTIDMSAIPHYQKKGVQALVDRFKALQDALPFGARTLRKIKEHLDSCSPTPMGYCDCPDGNVAVGTEEGADLVCSDVIASVLNTTGAPKHKPVIDIDLPCSLVESSPGKFHLYIDKEVDEDIYFRMVMAMVRAGIVEEGYYNASKHRGYTAVRHPDHPKVRPLSDMLTEVLDLNTTNDNPVPLPAPRTISENDDGGVGW